VAEEGGDGGCEKELSQAENGSYRSGYVHSEEEMTRV